MTAFFAFEIPIHNRNMCSIDGSACKRGALDRSEV